MSVRSARTWQRGRLPSEKKDKRGWRTRPDVETTVWMIKAKFGASVKSKSDTAQVNEVLCKILAHNVCVLIQSFYELGIETEFTTPASRDSKIIYLDGYRRDLSPARYG